MPASLITRQFRCLNCMADRPMSHFRVQFWTRSQIVIAGVTKPLTPSFWDLHCPECAAGPQFFDAWPKVCGVFTQLREADRIVVYRWHDKDGHEHYRYPAATDPNIIANQSSSIAERDRRLTDWRMNGALPRPNEERVEFPTLRSAESFLKEQNPNYRDWTMPLNDIFDYTNPDTAIDETDPGAAEDAADIAAVDDAGVATEDEIRAFMQRTDGAALIESA